MNSSMDVKTVPGVKWIESGQTNFSGPILQAFKKLDDLFIRFSQKFSAKEFQFPTFIQAKELAKLDYFKSFPHLITFPITLDSAEENLKEFIAGKKCDEKGQLHLTKTSPICDCLTPAACYHFYIHHQGLDLPEALYLTTRANCFRREAYYEPLQRQWGFNMREIVCIGTSDEVSAFLKKAREHLTQFFSKLPGFPLNWEIATDPFFDPTQNPKFLMQTLDPVKHEMIFDGKLSIGSINFHKNYFGEAFQIKHKGEEAFSGCVAFGMERWIYALIQTYGAQPENWPIFNAGDI